MVSVDTVYQKVLALANKEQRGYITPQDFNLFANQAQMEIFEQYFYDTSIARKTQGNDTVFADVDDMLEEKLQIFELTDETTTINNYTGSGQGLFDRVIPSYVYRVHGVILNGVKCEILNTNDFSQCRVTSLLAPSEDRPVVNIRNGVMRCLESANGFVVPTEIIYSKVPEQVNWTYVVINQNAMYDANASTQNFELHPSEQTQIINKILKLVGLSNQQPDVMRSGVGMEQAIIQQQPKI